MAAAIFRYCVRHPTRMLFIGLLLLLVIFSKFLYPSSIENKQVNDINVLKGYLSPAYAGLGSRVENSIRNAEKVKEESSTVVDHVDEKSFRAVKGKDSSQNSALNKDQVEAKKASKRIPFEESVTHSTISDEEKAENDLLQHKLPDVERSSNEHERKKSPFEMLVSEDDQHGNKKAQNSVQLTSKKSANPNLFLETTRNTMEKTRKERKNGLHKEQNNVLMVMAKVGKTSSLATRFKNCLLSICEYASVNLSFHIVVDKLGTMISTGAFAEAREVCKHGLDVTHYNVEEVLEKITPITEQFQHLFTSGHRSYFNDPIFFLSTALQHFLPQNIQRIILLDADLLFKSDIKQLFSMFDSFGGTNIFGLAREQQPVYRHIFDLYRDKNPGTKVGEPPPDGITGFNSGVLLVNVSNMNGSETYKRVLQNKVLESMANKYQFQGHLGDQDLYTLLSVEYSGLFYVLPCEWNRQLCTYWRDNGYADVFDLYYNCSEPVHVYHGNCRTRMPNE